MFYVKAHDVGSPHADQRDAETHLTTRIKRMLEQVVANVVANLISAIVVALIGLIVYFSITLTERQRVLRFFGIGKTLPRLRIYVPRLEILPGGTAGFEPVSEGYSGPSISKIDYEGALLVRDRLNSTLLTLLPKGVRDWFGQQLIGLSTVDPDIGVSPQTMELVSFDNLITLGGPVYNLVSKHYLEHPSSRFCFTRRATGERVIKLRTSGLEDIEIPGRSVGRELGVIQRINDHEHGNVVFVCAGLGSSAVYGSVRYLLENWKGLQQKYRESEFAICLAFPQQLPDSELVASPIVALQMP